MEREVLQLPVFLGRCLTELELSGELDFAPTTWDAVFEAFPVLRKLTLLGSLTAHHVIAGLFESLQITPASRTGKASKPDSEGANLKVLRRRGRCPALKELILDQIWWKPKTVETILECMKSRAERGAPRLDTLKLKADWLLSGSMSRKDSRYQHRFRKYVDDFILH